MSIFQKRLLTKKEVQVVKQFEYDEIDDTLITDSSLRAGLNSFELGEMHVNHSGGENVFWQNTVSETNWFPAWQGVKKFTNVGESVTFNPSIRSYTLPFQIFPNGLSNTNNTCTYNDIFSITENESILKLEVISAENYSGDIIYTLRDNSQNGTLKYSQKISGTWNINDPIIFNFTHPSESRANSLIAIDMFKENGDRVLLKESSNVPNKPFLKISLMNFVDRELQAGVVFINSNTLINSSAEYAIDCSLNSVILNINLDSGLKSFKLFDANQSFSPTNTCTINFGGITGTVILNSKNDSFLYYINDTNQRWMYLDLNTKDGGEL